MEYTICCDGINGYKDHWFFDKTYDPFDADITNVTAYAASCLEELGGGHADIYDENGEFVTDIEV